MVRKTIPELRDTLEPIFMELCPPELIEASTYGRTGGHYEHFTFPNGSTAMFRSLDDWNKHRSLNIGAMVIDEANEIDEETYRGMLSRVRQRDITEEARAAGYTQEITRRGIWLATNPNGHDWLYKRFVGHPEPRSEYFRSTSFDNPFLPPEYLDALLQYPEPWIRRYVLCSFDDFAGQIYEDWSWDTHVVDPLRDPKPNYVYWMGMDPGTRNPTAALWVNVDQRTKSLLAVAEYQQESLTANDHARAWREIEAKHKMNRVAWRVSDPQSLPARDRGSNVKLSDQYRRLGFNFQLGPSRTDDRIPALGHLISLGRFKVTKECPMTYEAIRDYRWADLSPAQRARGEDAPQRPHKHNDHLPDCGQYVSSRYIQTPKGLLVPEDRTFSDEIRESVRKHQAAKQRPRRHGELGAVM
jgi:PBSX family phage terminase large subunit